MPLKSLGIIKIPGGAESLRLRRMTLSGFPGVAGAVAAHTTALVVPDQRYVV